MRTAKSISFTTPVYNEIENIEECIDRVIQLHKEYFSELELEHIIIDNYSTDGTREYLDDVSNKHSHLKIIFNLGNFGLSNSPHFALLKTTGDIVIPIVADLQTPLEIVPEMYNIWKNGTDVVIAQRLRSASSGWRKVTQKYYYDFLQKLSDEEVIPNFIGFGLYDKRIIDLVKNQNDPAPYFRGFIQNIDPSRKVVTYVEKPRKAGKSKQNFRDKLELALLGITNTTTAPLYLLLLTGIIGLVCSVALSAILLIAKLVFWPKLVAGFTPTILVISFFAFMNFMAIGVIGIYLQTILSIVRNRPLVYVDRTKNM